MSRAGDDDAGAPRSFRDVTDFGEAAVSSRGSPPPSIPTLAAALTADDAEERRQAAGRLGELDLAAAIPLLMRAFGDSDWRVRKEAIFACQRIIQGAPAFGERRSRLSGDEAVVSSRRGVEAIDVLVAALIDALRSSDDVGLRNAAIEVLGHCGQAATPALVAALEDLDADGRKLVVEALGRTRDATALDALEKALAGSDDNVRQAAIEAIAAMGLIARERVTAVLRRSLVDRDRFVRLTGLHGLNALEAPVPWSVLAPLIHDSMLRPAALMAAALAESQEAPAALVSALSSARGSAFAHLVRALARLADGPLARHVADAVRSASPDVGARLVQATAAVPGVVAGMSEPPSSPSWRGLGTDPISGRAQALVLAAIARAPGAAEAAVKAMLEPALVEPAQRALAALGAHALPAVLLYLERHLETEPDLWEGIDDATAAILDAAVGIAQSDEGAEPHASALIEALRRSVRSPSTLVATSALYGLARIGVAADLELVAGHTLSASLPVARAAESALGALAEGHREAALALGQRLMQVEQTYLPAVVVLEVLGAAGPEQIGFLTHVAAAGNVRARRAAVTAVAAAAGARALDVLSLALADEEREVRIAAARAVGRLCGELGRSTEPVAEGVRARELLALVRTSGDPDLVSAAAQGDAASVPPPSRPSFWDTP